MVHPQGPRSRQYFVNNPADMGDYLKEFEHTFMLEFAQIYFFERLAPFKVLSLKDLSKCMIFLNFFIKRISLILDLGLTDERDLENPYQLEQYPRCLAMLASQMGMMNQRTIEQWTCHSRHTSVKKGLTSFINFSSNFPRWYEYIKQAMPLVCGCVLIVYSRLSLVPTLNYI